MEERRVDQGGRRPEDWLPSSEVRPARPTPLERFAPVYVLYNLLWHRRQGGSKVPFLVGMLIVQLVIVALLVYWVL